MRKVTSRTRCLIAPAAAVALVLGVASCGGDDESAEPRQADVATGDTTTARAPAASQDDGRSDRERVADVVTGMYGALARGNAAGVCAAMSTQARDQVAQQVFGGTDDPPAQRSCEKSFSKFLEAAASSGITESTLHARVEGVEVDGRAATATVSFGSSDKSGKIALVKESGDWRLRAAPGTN